MPVTLRDILREVDGVHLVAQWGRATRTIGEATSALAKGVLWNPFTGDLDCNIGREMIYDS